jgi:hypothetical protein
MSQRLSLTLKFCSGLIIVLAAAGPGFGQDFYKGKNLVIIVGTAPGGGFDTYSRILARHIVKHIPGNPTSLVQNMPGAGNLIAANYMYNRAAPDGLTIGHFSGSMIFKHVLGDQGVLFEEIRLAGHTGTGATHLCPDREKRSENSGRLDRVKTAYEARQSGSRQCNVGVASAVESDVGTAR